MKGFVQFILERPVHAVFVAAFLAYFPLLSIISASVLVLVLLQHKLNQGVLVFCLAHVPAALMSIVQLNDYFPLLIFSSSFILALLLKGSKSLSFTLSCAALSAAIANGLIFYLGQLNIEDALQLFIPDTTQLNLDITSIQLTMAALISVYITLPVIIGRWWQAHLYAGTPFAKEFGHLRISMRTTYLLLTIAMILVVLGRDMLAVAVASPYILAAIGLVHDIAKRKNLINLWLIIFYFTLMTLNYALVVLIVTGVLDSLLNIRKRI